MMRIPVKNIEKTGVTDYWIIFSEVTEMGDNVGYFIIGALCFISGLTMWGVLNSPYRSWSR